MPYRYILEPYHGKNSRFTCPSCGKPHRFTRYIDTETGEYLADNAGICNRVNNCGYHYTPKDYFRDNKIFAPPSPPVRKQIKPPTNNPALPRFIPREIFQKSLTGYRQNNFITYLKLIFDRETIFYLINIYKIGTSKHFNGGTTVFWQIDTANRIRTGKLIKYDPLTGKRIKKPFPATTWAHSLLYKEGYNLSQCLFGEHLLAEVPGAPVAIVESEKTAVIAQAKLPAYIWLATGSLTEFKPAKLNILRNRKVVAFPDLGGCEKWQKTASALDFPIIISDYLEKNATGQQRKQGLDIADFL
jgi:hypothetical protein